MRAFTRSSTIAYGLVRLYGALACNPSQLAPRVSRSMVHLVWAKMSHEKIRFSNWGGNSARGAFYRSQKLYYILHQYTPVIFCYFIINPHDFATTIQNLFLHFLRRDKLVPVDVKKDYLQVLYPVFNIEESNSSSGKIMRAVCELKFVTSKRS